MRFEMTSGSGGNTRTWTFGGGNTLGGGAGPVRPRNMDEYVVNNLATAFTILTSHIFYCSFIRRRDEPGLQRGDISGAMMAQYLMALLASGPGRRGQHGGDPTGDPFGGPGMGGPEGGRWGDYAFSQDGVPKNIGVSEWGWLT